MKRFRDTTYLVTNTGEVFNKKGRQLKPWLVNGYLIVGLGAKFRISVHRLVAEVYCKGYNPELDVNHIDGNKLNNDASNLEWCTRSHNCQHAFDTGLSKRRNGHTDSVGSKNSMARLNETKVKVIRELYETGQYTYSDLAKEFTVNQATIGYVIQRKTWKHI